MLLITGGFQMSKAQVSKWYSKITSLPGELYCTYAFIMLYYTYAFIIYMYQSNNLHIVKDIKKGFKNTIFQNKQ